MSKPYKEVGKRLKNVRNALGLNQTMFGLLIYKRRNSIARYEGGDTKIPREVLQTITLHTEINSRWLETAKGTMFQEDQPTYKAKISTIRRLLDSYPKIVEKLYKVYPEYHEEIKTLSRNINRRRVSTIESIGSGKYYELLEQADDEDKTIALVDQANGANIFKVWSITGAGNRFDYFMQETNPENLEPMERIELNGLINNNFLEGFKVSGDSMVPGILDGAYIAVNFKDKQLKTGKLFVFNYPHEGLVVKAVQVKKDRVKIYSYNDSYDPEEYPYEDIDEHIIVGRVMWIYQNT